MHLWRSGRTWGGYQENTTGQGQGQMLKLGLVASNHSGKDGGKPKEVIQPQASSSITVTPHFTILYVRVPNKVPKRSSTLENIV